MVALSHPILPQEHMLQALQNFATKEDLQYWASQGLEMTPEGIIAKKGRVGIPQSSAPLFISRYHGIGHRGYKETAEVLTVDFCIQNLFHLCKEYVCT